MAKKEASEKKGELILGGRVCLAFGGDLRLDGKEGL